MTATRLGAGTTRVNEVIDKSNTSLATERIKNAEPEQGRNGKKETKSCIESMVQLYARLVSGANEPARLCNRLSAALHNLL